VNKAAGGPGVLEPVLVAVNDDGQLGEVLLSDVDQQWVGHPPALLAVVLRGTVHSSRLRGALVAGLRDGVVDIHPLVAAEVLGSHRGEQHRLADLDDELEHASEKADLFEKVFKRKVHFLIQD